MLKLLLVEDDPIQAEMLISEFEDEFRDVEIKRIVTEKQFRDEITNIESFAPDLIILDVMIRWANHAQDITVSPEPIEAEGMYRAGFRCLKLISDSKRLYDTPVILHSILQKGDLREELDGLPKHIVVSSKGAPREELFMFVRSVLKELPEGILKEKTIISKLIDSSELKPGWFGIKVDLKSIFGKKRKS